MSHHVVIAGSRHTGVRFAFPWLLGLVVFLLCPMVASFVISLTEWDGLSIRENVTWRGLSNYRELLGAGDGAGHDRLFIKSMANSVMLTLWSVPATLAVALIVAMLLNTRVAGSGFFRVVYVLPYLMSGVATMLIWSWLFNPRFGWVNKVIRQAYDVVDPLVRSMNETGTSEWPLPGWFYSPAFCKPALILMRLWLGGSAMLVFLAALQRVPKTLHESAAIDGAGTWRRFRHVTLPHISPAILFNAAVGIVFSMQSFDQAYLLYNRAQEDGLLLSVLYLYRVAFEPPYRIGYASAIAWILFVVISGLAMVVIMPMRRRIYYEIDK